MQIATYEEKTFAVFSAEIKHITRTQHGSPGYMREKYSIEIRTCILGISVISYASGGFYSLEKSHN